MAVEHKMKWVVTGAAGFIGTNLVKRLIELGHDVAGIDDLSRLGVQENADFLKRTYDFNLYRTDITDREPLWSTLDREGQIDIIVHLAGQVSFLASIENPWRDFEINAVGTLNLLEYIRLYSPATKLIALSSNKVYGDLSSINTVEEATRYRAPDWPNGFDESLPLDFHGPYGCSKGVLDQYVADYARIFGLKCCSIRQSSVYGPHQHPASDQGWVGHILKLALQGEHIQLNGYGKQVRDILHVSDLTDLFLALSEQMPPPSICQINVGGGPQNSLSILELLSHLEILLERKCSYSFGPFRPSDQRIFISDNSRVSTLTGWRPKMHYSIGIEKLL